MGKIIECDEYIYYFFSIECVCVWVRMCVCVLMDEWGLFIKVRIEKDIGIRFGGILNVWILFYKIRENGVLVKNIRRNNYVVVEKKLKRIVVSNWIV